MTTLIVTSSWPRTGDEIAGTFVRRDALVRARRDRVIVAAPEGAGAARVGDGLTVVDVPHGGLFGSPGATERARRAPWRVLGLVAFARSIRALIDEVRPATIVAHWLVPSGLVVAEMLAHPIGRLELVAHGADVRLLRALPPSIARRLVERIARRAEVVRAVAPPLAARLLELAPLLAQKLVIAPMPLATDEPAVRRDVERRAANLREGLSPLHVVASRLVASKRIERAIDHVARHGGRLVLVGDGPMRASLAEHARRRGVDARFVGARPHDEALGWIAAADVVLAPLALDEGAPTAAREAESLGRAVICFRD